ncbi:unnamed protein product, partial [Musa banksii]
MARVALVAGLMAVYALSVSAAVAAPPPADCSNVVTSLLDCLPYVTNGSDTASPSKACCAGVATVVTQSPVCICQSLDEASNLGIALNITRVVGLPVACSVRAPKVHCDAASPPGGSPRKLSSHSHVLHPHIHRQVHHHHHQDHCHLQVCHRIRRQLHRPRHLHRRSQRQNLLRLQQLHRQARQ